MAMYRLQIRPLGRATGRKAVNAAAYRAGERIRDERTGTVYDHTKRADVLHAEIVLPSGLGAQEAAWTKNRAVLWNTAERAETRKNSRVAREYQIALPSELTPGQRTDLALTFSREIAERYRVVVDTTVHAPRAGSDQRNYHAHLLSTTREAASGGLGRKSDAELRDRDRRQRGLLTSREEFKFIRERWAVLANEALRQAGLDVRIDHRSLKDQGIDREPRPTLPWGAYRAEREGRRSEIAERIRQRYRERVAAREARISERAVDGRRGRSLEDVRQEAREAWLQFRARARAATAGPEKGALREATATRRLLSVAPDTALAKEGPVRSGRDLDAGL
jgi:ATP-dependent exoDNAse (exonuclease V) alpha subunit